MPEEKKEPSFYEQVHNKDIRQIIHEANQSARGESDVPRAEDKTEETPKEIEPKAQEEEKAKEEDNQKEVEQAKRQEEERQEVARRAAEEVVAKQKAEEKARLEEEQRKQEAAKREEEKKYSWQRDPNRKKDEHGNPLPQSYDEIAAEAQRVAEANIMAKIEAREAQKAAEAAEAARKQQAEEAEKKRIQDEFNKQLEAEINSDLNDLYSSGKLPKIKDPNDPKDPGRIEQTRLFELGQKINMERIKKGLPPVRSIKLIYYEHYKPPKNPAGHDAPVIGNGTPPPSDNKEERYNWARDHKKTPAQLLKEEKKKAMQSAKLHA